MPKKLPIEYRVLEARLQKLERRIKANASSPDTQLAFMRKLMPLKMKMVRIYDAAQ